MAPARVSIGFIEKKKAYQFRLELMRQSLNLRLLQSDDPLGRQKTCTQRRVPDLAAGHAAQQF